MTKEPSTRCHCQNCDWTGDFDDVDPYKDFWDRVEPGDIVPAGDCPECGAHCMPDELTDPVRDAAYELLAALKGVVRVADRKTVEFDAARAAIAKAEGV